MLPGLNPFCWTMVLALPTRLLPPPIRFQKVTNLSPVMISSSLSLLDVPHRPPTRRTPTHKSCTELKGVQQTGQVLIFSSDKCGIDGTSTKVGKHYNKFSYAQCFTVAKGRISWSAHCCTVITWRTCSCAVCSPRYRNPTNSKSLTSSGPEPRSRPFNIVIFASQGYSLRIEDICNSG